jgi:hypothetical protein
MADDIFDIEDTTEGDPSLERLVKMAQELVDQEQLIKDLEENLTTAKRVANKLKTTDLPDLMAEVGMASFKLPSGYAVAVEDFVSGSLPKEPEKRQGAIHWLEENGAEALIRTEVMLEFSKSEHNEALSLIADLEEKGYEPESKMGIHPQTLLAHVRERLRNGEEVPLETLGLYAGRVAKVKPPKESKGSRRIDGGEMIAVTPIKGGRS